MKEKLIGRDKGNKKMTDNKLIKLPKAAKPLEQIVHMGIDRKSAFLHVDPSKTKVQRRDGKLLIELSDTSLEDIFSAPEAMREVLQNVYEHPEKFGAESLLALVKVAKPMTYDLHGPTFMPPTKQYQETIDGFNCVFSLGYDTHAIHKKLIGASWFNLKQVKLEGDFDLDHKQLQALKQLNVKFANPNETMAIGVPAGSKLTISENFFNSGYSAILGTPGTYYQKPRLFKHEGEVYLGNEEAREMLRISDFTVSVTEEGKGPLLYKCGVSVTGDSISLQNLGPREMCFAIQDREKAYSVDRIIEMQKES
jgi:hypothetical protein